MDEGKISKEKEKENHKSITKRRNGQMTEKKTQSK